jgi:hypothetical protein
MTYVMNVRQGKRRKRWVLHSSVYTKVELVAGEVVCMTADFRRNPVSLAWRMRDTSVCDVEVQQRASSSDIFGNRTNRQFEN